MEKETCTVSECPTHVRTRSNVGHSAIRRAVYEFSKLPEALFNAATEENKASLLASDRAGEEQDDIESCIHKAQDALIAGFPCWTETTL